MRRNQASVVASPVLVGAVTVLVVTIAVLLSYNANSGLPFVSTRQLRVEIADAQELVKGNDVRDGGFRVGIVEDLQPALLANGSLGALVTLKLDRREGAVPVDSTAVIRPRSALGTKYLELTRGSSPHSIADGGTLPVAQAHAEVDIDQLFNAFDARTRAAERTNIKEAGNAFAARGAEINTTLGELPRTLGLLAPVARNLADPRTRLGEFFRRLEVTALTLAPVSSALGRLFGNAGETFAALSRDPQALRSTIAKTPRTLAVGTRALALTTPFLRHSASFASDLRGAVHELRGALPALDGALEAGAHVAPSVPGFARDLDGALAALRDLAGASATNAALRGLTATVTTLQPQLRFLGPYITVCNYWNFFWTFAAEAQTAPGPGGTALRNGVILANQQNNNLGSEGAAVPANGEGVPPTEVPEYLHSNAYLHAITDDGRADCGYGQTGYIGAANSGAPGRFQHLVLDPDLPLGYALGPTYKTIGKDGPQGLGPDRVPTGETFTSQPGGSAAQIDHPRSP